MVLCADCEHWSRRGTSDNGECSELLRSHLIGFGLRIEMKGVQADLCVTYESFGCVLGTARKEEEARRPPPHLTPKQKEVLDLLPLCGSLGLKGTSAKAAEALVAKGLALRLGLGENHAVHYARVRKEDS